MARFCTQCGKEIIGEPAFCTECGSPLPKADPPAATETVIPSSQFAPGTAAAVGAGASSQAEAEEESLSVSEVASVAEPASEESPASVEQSVPEEVPAPVEMPQKQFCPHCGKEIKGDPLFCTACGGALKKAQRAPSSPGKVNGKLVGIIGAFGGVVAAVTVLLILLLGGGYEDAFDRYAEFCFGGGGTVEEMLEFAPDAFWRENDPEEAYAVVERSWERFGDVRLSYEIREENSLYSSDLRYINEELEEYGLTAEEGVMLEVEMSLHAPSGEEQSTTTVIRMVEIDGEWYVYPFLN